MLFKTISKQRNESDAMKMILSEEAPESEDFNDSKFLEIYEQAMDLYGLIHARFILSPKGLAMMKEKFLMGGFGTCP